MKRRYWGALFLILLVLALAGVGSLHRTRLVIEAEEEFFDLREKVRKNLFEQAGAALDGVTVTMPTPEKLRTSLVDNTISNEEHIQSVLHGPEWFGIRPLPRDEWNSTHNFQLLLKLDERAFPQGTTLRSGDMTAMILLDHYFGNLSELGFRSLGQGSTAMGQVQSASSEWIMDGNRSIVVSGTVFVAEESKEAIVLGTIREQFPR